MFRFLLISTTFLFVYVSYLFVGEDGFLQPNKSSAKELEIPKGFGIVKISDLLESEKIIPSSKVFSIFAYAFDRYKNLQAGTYFFEKGITPFEVLQKIYRGNIKKYTVTIPEGYSVHKIFDILKKHKNLSGDMPEKPVEGSLFPGTYNYKVGEKRENLVIKMKLEMNKKIKKLTSKYKDNPYSKTPDKVIILASIIEKESAKNSDRRKISGVFFNRLKKGMRLQSCPTVVYGITFGKRKMKRPVSYEDLKINSPYNTYVNKGLPPTPICCPSLDSLESVFNPENHNYYFFVANNNGYHIFSETFRDHKKQKLIIKGRKK